MKFLGFGQLKLGSSLSLPAHGRAGARATLLAALFAKQKTKFDGGESEGGQKFLVDVHSPTPFPRTRTSSVRDFAFCPPERKLSKVSVRIFAEKSSDFVQDRQLFIDKFL